jgi:hypothetical protein
LITSLLRETVGASLVVKAYFERWPNEELQFKSMKSIACLNRVAGYGKKKLPDEKAREKQSKLEGQISNLQQKLEVPLESLAEQEERLALALGKQRRIHFSCPIVDGRRIVDEASQARLKSLAREIAQLQRQIKLIEAECDRDLKRLKRSEKQWLRLQGKDFIYQIDVELDQIMTFFRISLVNICCWFLREYMKKSSMSLAKLLNTILLLPWQYGGRRGTPLQECCKCGSRSTRIRLCFSICQRSYLACIPSQTSGVDVPNARVSRTAISGDTAAFPFRTRDKVTRPMPRCFAAAATLISPRYSRMTSQRCGGLCIRISLSFLSDSPGNRPKSHPRPRNGR